MADDSLLLLGRWLSHNMEQRPISNDPTIIEAEIRRLRLKLLAEETDLLTAYEQAFGDINAGIRAALQVQRS